MGVRDSEHAQSQYHMMDQWPMLLHRKGLFHAAHAPGIRWQQHHGGSGICRSGKRHEYRIVYQIIDPHPHGRYGGESLPALPGLPEVDFRIGVTVCRCLSDILNANCKNGYTRQPTGLHIWYSSASSKTYCHCALPRGRILVNPPYSSHFLRQATLSQVRPGSGSLVVGDWLIAYG